MQILMGICLSCPKQVNANMVVYNTIIRKTLQYTRKYNHLVTRMFYNCKTIFLRDFQLDREHRKVYSTKLIVKTISGNA